MAVSPGRVRRLWDLLDGQGIRTLNRSLPVLRHDATKTNPFDAQEVASRYESWYTAAGRRADILEKRLLGKLMADFPQASSVIDIGCGTGHFTRWIGQQGLQTAGLDRSPAMLDEARKLNGATYLLGDALDLPFADRAFDLALVVTTLEFVADPLLALSEAVRVARHGVILGVLNRWSLLARGYRSSAKPVWRSARFFSPFELRRLVRRAAGGRLRRVRWRTTLWPAPWTSSLPLPWGGFIGLSAHLGNEGNKH